MVIVFSFPETNFQRTMTICARRLSWGNLGHGHRLFLSQKHQGFFTRLDPNQNPRKTEKNSWKDSKHQGISLVRKDQGKSKHQGTEDQAYDLADQLTCENPRTIIKELKSKSENRSRSSPESRTKIVQKCAESSVFNLLSGELRDLLSDLLLPEGRKRGVRSVVVGFGVFGAPRFSVQRSPNTYF